jgi:hypothetical protein
MLPVLVSNLSASSCPSGAPLGNSCAHTHARVCVAVCVRVGRCGCAVCSTRVHKAHT